MSRLNPWRAALRAPGDWPLAGKIIALSAGACALVALFLATLGYSHAVEGLNVQAERALTSDALLVVQAVDLWNLARLNDVRAVAATAATRHFLEEQPGEEQPGSRAPATIEALQDLLESQDRFSPDVDSIAVLDADGIILASSNRLDVGQSVRQRDYFRSAMEGRPFVSGVSASIITNVPSIFHAAPVFSRDGQVLGVVRSRSGLTEMNRSVQDAGNRVGAGAGGVLLDEAGLVIASSVGRSWFLRPVVPLSADALEDMVQDRRWGNNDPPSPLGLPALVPAIGIRNTMLLDLSLGELQLHAVATPMQTTRWTYVGALPVDTIEASARSLQRNVLLVALAVLIAVVLLTAAVARGVTRRLGRLSRAALALDAGTLSDEEIADLRESQGGDEVAALMRVFGRTAGS
jgi:hypothetical protein